MDDIACHVDVEDDEITITLGEYIVRIDADQAQILSQALALAKATVDIPTNFRVLSIKVPIGSPVKKNAEV